MEQILRYLRLPELMQHTDGVAVTAESWQRRRGELLYDLQRFAYGFLPPEPLAVGISARVGYDAGWGMDGQSKVRTELCELELSYPTGTYRFPFKLMKPLDVEKPALLVTVGMSLEGIFAALPPEGFVQKGVAVAAVAANEITADAPGFADGICPLLWPDGHTGADAGKLLIWGRCMGYVKDALLRSGEFDETHVGAAGCSRYGKTAMVAGAFDEGFTHTVSVCSGTGGASLLRGKIGETVARITENYGYWFNDAYKAAGDDVDELQMDAHFLAAAVAPRKLLVCSAYEDFWCDPFHEYLTCIAASPAWEVQGAKGFIYPEPKDVNPGPRYAKIGETMFEGDVCYSLRAGGHGMPPEDWEVIGRFMTEK